MMMKMVFSPSSFSSDFAVGFEFSCIFEISQPGHAFLCLENPRRFPFDFCLI